VKTFTTVLMVSPCAAYATFPSMSTCIAETVDPVFA
jgi:hypothetical protein